MSDHKTIDLMPCQMCGWSKPYFIEVDGYSRDAYVYCDNCQLYAPEEKSNEDAINQWNRMQSLIAKGLLLEATEKSGNKGGRL